MSAAVTAMASPGSTMPCLLGLLVKLRVACPAQDLAQAASVGAKPVLL